MVFINKSIAQTQGQLLVSGASSLSFGAKTEKETYQGDQVGNKEKTSGFGLNPTVGYFIMDNLAIGLTLSENHSKSKFEDDTDVEHSTKTNEIICGPIGRYYYGTTSLRPFGQAFIGFGSYKVETTVGNVSTTPDKRKIFGFGAGIGAAYFIKENISFDAILGYSYFVNTDTEETDYKWKDSALDLKVGISVFF